MQAILNIAIRAARKAGAHLLRERERMDNFIDGRELSTLQGQAETILREVIAKAYPDHGVHVLQAGEALPEQETIWHLDLVNGAENLARNLPNFAIVLLVVERGVARHGLVFSPMTDEIYTASKGDGVQCNNYRLRVSKNTELANATIASAQPELELRAAGSQIYNQACPVLDLAYVAAGRLDAFCGENLSPLELQIGNLLIKEAGGLAGDLSGGHDMDSKKQMLAANSKLFKAIVQQRQS